MATQTFSIQVRTNDLPRLRSALPQRMANLVDGAAEAIRTRAYQMAPRDTTSLAESIYVTNGATSDYAQRAGTARQVNKQVEILDEIRPEFVLGLSGPVGEGAVSVVGVAAGHGIYLEYGTRYMAPQPYMTPAIEGERDPFIESLKTIADL